MNTYWFAIVDTSRSMRSSIHFRGMPSEIAGGKGYREALPPPRVLIIEETSEGVSLYRYTADGSDSGDTWHMSVDDAKHQAEFEYGDVLGVWKIIPAEVTDPVEYALTYINE